ncbi:MAG TPA: hypothetical protein VNS59_07170 [Lysobacter sp.]|jgi:hypothetical protein|nr:hypothetical protein [Lysobacter sp.]
MHARQCCLIGVMLLVLSACAARDSAATSGGSQAAPASPAKPASVPSRVYEGWYMEHGGLATFQPCGQATLRIGDAADIPTRASSFGVTDDNPVYVRLKGTIADGRFDAISVEQFGSAEPVQGCSMTGTMTP